MKSVSLHEPRLPVHFFEQQARKIKIIEAQGGDVIRLDIGSPDLSPPVEVIDSLVEHARKDHFHGYQSHNGIPELREAWSNWYSRLFGVALDPSRHILPLLGSKEGIFHLPLALISEGDAVLIPDPGYVSYTRGTVIAGGEPVPYRLPSEHDYLPNLEEIPDSVARRARLMWLNYPNNPTGATASLEFFEKIVRFAVKCDILICHDAAYSQVTFQPGIAPSILQVAGADRVAVEFNSLSKSHNMPGWRVGVVVGNEEVINALYTLKTNADSGHFRPILEAATLALSTGLDWIEERNRIYLLRRNIVVDNLNSMNLPAYKSNGTIYVWFQVPDGWTSETFVSSILENAWVSLTPGTLFGKNGEGFVRLALTVPHQRIEEAMHRIRNWIVDRVPQ